MKAGEPRRVTSPRNGLFWDQRALLSWLLRGGGCSTYLPACLPTCPTCLVDDDEAFPCPSRAIVSEALRDAPQLRPLGYHEQRPRPHALAAPGGLEHDVDPDLPVALPALPGLELVVAQRPRPRHVEAVGVGGTAVLDVEARGEHAEVPGAEGRVGDGGARAVLVQDGGDEPAVHDERPAGGVGAEVDDVDDLGRVGGGAAGRVVVEDVLVGADARGAAEGARGDAARAQGVGDGGVGFVVRPWRAVPSGARWSARVRDEVVKKVEGGGRRGEGGRRGTPAT